jgi:hypothetical protein
MESSTHSPASSSLIIVVLVGSDCVFSASSADSGLFFLRCRPGSPRFCSASVAESVA